mmetsp:Transcript_14292/g.40580  ORF Transcript_14292/g.40580 Transcript_14292/m.40580 type:complete len:95 (+) Transcript_14292:1580-1864(+)
MKMNMTTTGMYLLTPDLLGLPPLPLRPLISADFYVKREALRTTQAKEEEKEKEKKKKHQEFDRTTSTPTPSPSSLSPRLALQRSCWYGDDDDDC